MKVRATLPDGKFGFYGTQRRYGGDEFDLDDDAHFSKEWMEVVEEKPKRGRPKKEEEGGE